MFGKKELEKEIIRLKEENQKLADSYGKSKSHEIEEQICELKDEIKFQQNKIESLISHNKELEQQKQQILFNYKQIEKDNDIQKDIIKNCEINKKIMESKLKETEHIVAERNSKLEELESQIKELNQKLKEQDIEISAYKNAIANISFTFNNDGKINPKEFNINDYIANEEKINEDKKTI